MKEWINIYIKKNEWKYKIRIKILVTSFILFHLIIYIFSFSYSLFSSHSLFYFFYFFYFSFISFIHFLFSFSFSTFFPSFLPLFSHVKSTAGTEYTHYVHIKKTYTQREHKNISNKCTHIDNIFHTHMNWSTRENSHVYKPKRNARVVFCVCERDRKREREREREKAMYYISL